MGVEKKTFLLTLPEDLHMEVKLYSVKSEMSMNDLIVNAVKYYVNHLKTLEEEGKNFE